MLRDLRGRVGNDDKGYLNKDGSINENFQFVCEVDASANDEDRKSVV